MFSIFVTTSFATRIYSSSVHCLPILVARLVIDTVSKVYQVPTYTWTPNLACWNLLRRMAKCFAYGI